MLDKIEKALWRYLFENGGILKEKGYYGGLSIERFKDYGSTKKSKLIKSYIDDNQVNWYQTQALKDNMIDVFNSTFDDSTNYTYYIEGDLILNDGTSYHCACEVKNDSFTDSMREIHGFMVKYIMDD